jgi:hypothetical protein
MKNFISPTLRERKFAVDKFFSLLYNAIGSFPQLLQEKLSECFIRFWRTSMNAKSHVPVVFEITSQLVGDLRNNFREKQQSRSRERKTHGECDELFYGILRGFS